MFQERDCLKYELHIFALVEHAVDVLHCTSPVSVLRITLPSLKPRNFVLQILGKVWFLQNKCSEISRYHRFETQYYDYTRWCSEISLFLHSGIESKMFWIFLALHSYMLIHGLMCISHFRRQETGQARELSAIIEEGILFCHWTAPNYYDRWRTKIAFNLFWKVIAFI